MFISKLIIIIAERINKIEKFLEYEKTSTSDLLILNHYKMISSIQKVKGNESLRNLNHVKKLANMASFLIKNFSSPSFSHFVQSPTFLFFYTLYSMSTLSVRCSMYIGALLYMLSFYVYFSTFHSTPLSPCDPVCFFFLLN